jgi:phosphohistidine phosphatase
MLVLLRHGDAEPKGTLDFDRHLTDEGMRQSRSVGAGLSKHGIRPDLVVTSPAARALETAVLAAAPLSYERDRIVRDPAVYDADVRTLLEVVAQRAAGACVMLVGHNPGFSALAAVLAGLERHWSLEKGHAAVLELRDGWASLEPTSAHLVRVVAP